MNISIRLELLGVNHHAMNVLIALATQLRIPETV